MIGLRQVRRISQTAFEKLKVIPREGLVWRTNEDDPRKHTLAHEGLHYQLPDEKQLIQIFGYPSPFTQRITIFYKAIGLIPIMVRKPALTTMDYLERVNYQLPSVRFLFYGDLGRGKTHTLAHLVHYLHMKQEHIIIHIRRVAPYVRGPSEIAPSTSRPGRIDTPLDAALLLKQFLTQNAQLLERVGGDLTCSKDYTWSLREVTKAGEPIANIAEHGVNRVIHASDCVAVLFKELALAADGGKIKLASVIDGTRYLFEDLAGKLKHQDHKKMYVDEITIARALKKLIKGTHRNGILLASCEGHRSDGQNQTPRQILGIEGWNHFDPFIPIHVPNYSRKEFESRMNMYQDMGWLCRPESCTQEARDEVRFVSGLNPGEVHYLCQPM